MTLPNERFSAIINTREFLRSLLDPKKTPKVPKHIRISAYYCLRHFPSDHDLGDPDAFAYNQDYWGRHYLSQKKLNKKKRAQP